MLEADGRSTTETYWDVQFGQRADQAKYAFDDWIDETLDVMRRAVKRRC